MGGDVEIEPTGFGSTLRVLVAGCGYVGGRLAEMLVRDGHDVWGLKRDPSSLPTGVKAVGADVTEPATLTDLPPDLHGVVYAVSPGHRREDAYRRAYVLGLRNVLDAVGSTRMILVSSTGVYGDKGGAWVDEETPPEPETATGQVIAEGESLVRERGQPGVVLRLGGIYGPGRTWGIRRVLSGEAPCLGPDVYGNRIHRDDAAGAARHLLTLADPDPVYLGVDRDPAPLREVNAWVAERAGVADPCQGVDPDDVRTGGRRGSNKRCSSQRLVDAGYTFAYPSYRDGYPPLIAELLGH